MKYFTCFILILIYLSISNLQNVEGCTAFCLAKKGNYVLAGKNLDWPIGDGFIVINKKGVPKQALVNPGEKPAQWITKFGSVTFNQFGKGFPLGGMNEMGLVVEELSYSPSIYPTNISLYCLNELQWIQYQLDNYHSVEEVIKNLSRVQISKFLFGLHYFICDRFGNTVVIEFIEGKTLVYSGTELPFQVLTNNTYANSIKYIKKHKGFGGTLIVRNGPESPERFVRTAGLVRNYLQSASIPPVDYAFHVLANVRQLDTQWSIVYDTIALKISFSTKDGPNINTLNLKAIDFTTRSTKTYSLIGDKFNSKNFMSSFSLFNPNKNQELITRVFNKMVQLEEIDSDVAASLREKLLKYQQVSLDYSRVEVAADARKIVNRKW